MNKQTIIQKKLLDMLKMFHLICNENNIRYYIIGGTMLGAIRHKGFIPWDDDIDVAVPREDFEKLMSIVQKNDYKNYYFEDPYSCDRYYPYPYIKMYDKTTTLIENNNNKITRGLYIDIFPLDGIANSKKKININFFKIQFYKNLLTLRIINNNKNRSFIKKMIIEIVHKLPKKYYAEDVLRKRINKICSQRLYDDYEYVGNLVGAYGKKEIMKKEIFGKPTQYRFEDIMVFGVEKYDEYLSNLYNDYMSLPSEEKRVASHDRYLDLNKAHRND